MPFSSPSAGIRGRRANPSSFLLQCSPYYGEIPHPQLSPTHQSAHYTTTPHTPPKPQKPSDSALPPSLRRQSQQPLCPRGLARAGAAKGRGSCPAGCPPRAPTRGRPGSAGQGRPAGGRGATGAPGRARRREQEAEGHRVLLTRRRHCQQLGQVRVAAVILDLPVDDAARDLQRLLRGGRRWAHGGGHGDGDGDGGGRGPPPHTARKRELATRQIPAGLARVTQFHRADGRFRPRREGEGQGGAERRGPDRRRRPVGLPERGALGGEGADNASRAWGSSVAGEELPRPGRL